MFQLLYPLGLLASLGIAIPVLIHLWNVKSGKTLKIGSVFLLGMPSNQRSRSLKVQDWPLLLLRCLLILLIAFLMAKPVYQQLLKTSESAGWVLVKKVDFSKLWKQQHHLLDSLVKNGYEVHDLDVAFEKIDLKDTLTSFSRADKKSVPYFSLIRQLDAQHLQGSSMYVFTDNKLDDFTGQKPETHLKLHWNFLPVDSNTRSWPTLAFETQSGKIRQLTAKAKALGIHYVSEEVEKAVNDIQVDTSTLRIQIYTAKNSPDAAYVSSAVMAAADFTRRKVVLQKINSAAELSANANLVFWLSDKLLTTREQDLLSKPKALFIYAEGKVEKVNSIIRDLSGISTNVTALHRRIALKKEGLEPLWLDGSGNPVLGKTERKGSIRYEFYSRFRPDWTDLVWSEQMMSFILPVIFPATAAEPGFRDKGKLPVGQDDIAFSEISKAGVKANIKYQEQSFSSWLWWLLILVFFVERWISYRKNSMTT